MKDETFREPLKTVGRFFVYDWNEHNLFRMQWLYLIDWPEDGGAPRIWITSYTCWQRQTPDAPFEEIDQIPFDVPMSTSILQRLAEHAGEELYRRSLVVGSLKSVPENFFERAGEAAEKGYSLKSLREISQVEAGYYTPPASREEWVREMSLSSEEFAAKTGASVGFNPAHPKQWAQFWKQDICEKGEFHTWFPKMHLAEARRVWRAMEEHFFAKYEMFVRVWPEWYSSGIWAPPYPGSRAAGGMIGYDYFALPEELVERFKSWQAEYDEHEPWAPEKFDWKSHWRSGDALALNLKAVLGSKVYVEHRELVEILPDGSVASCRPRLGLPETASEQI
jgi:hypothetical protein